MAYSFYFIRFIRISRCQHPIHNFTFQLLLINGVQLDKYETIKEIEWYLLIIGIITKFRIERLKMVWGIVFGSKETHPPHIRPIQIQLAH